MPIDERRSKIYVYIYIYIYRRTESSRVFDIKCERSHVVELLLFAAITGMFVAFPQYTTNTQLIIIACAMAEIAQLYLNNFFLNWSASSSTVQGATTESQAEQGDPRQVVDLGTVFIWCAKDAYCDLGRFQHRQPSRGTSLRRISVVPSHYRWWSWLWTIIKICNSIVYICSDASVIHWCVDGVHDDLRTVEDNCGSRIRMTYRSWNVFHLIFRSGVDRSCVLTDRIER